MDRALAGLSHATPDLCRGTAGVGGAGAVLHRRPQFLPDPSRTGGSGFGHGGRRGERGTRVYWGDAPPNRALACLVRAGLPPCVPPCKAYTRPFLLPPPTPPPTLSPPPPP